MGFGKSFDEAFKPAFAQSQAGALDALKEKIKKETESAEKATRLSAIKQSSLQFRENAIKSGFDPRTVSMFTQAIAVQNDPDTAEKILTAGLSAVSDISKERQKSKIKSQEEDATLKKFGINISQPSQVSTESSEESTKSPLLQIQKQLPEDVSLKIGDITVTGSKVDVSQKKLINEISATQSTIDRIAVMTQNVPDLGGVNFKTEGQIGKVLSLLPRGMEGRAREFSSKYFTAGGGGGITGLSQKDETNLRSYMSNLPTIGTDAYKALSGDTGKLSDFDSERGMNLLWRPDKGETIEIRDQKNSILQEAVKEREKAIRQGEFTIDPNTGAILTPQIVSKALTKLSGGKQNIVLMEIPETKQRALVNSVTGEVIKEL